MQGRMPTILLSGNSPCVLGRDSARKNFPREDSVAFGVAVLQQETTLN